MTQMIASISYWLHALATVIFIGHYVLLALIYLPALAENGPALGDISKRSRPWMYASLIIFMVTGIYLMVVDPNYLGIGNFSNPWAVLMLVKHALIIGMIVLGFWYNAILRVGQSLRSSSTPAQAVVRYRRYANLMAVSGVLIMLLTALAQAK